jgi:hypothetical protein
MSDTKGAGNSPASKITVHKGLYIGGLMRCCTDSLAQYLNAGGTEATGTIVQCKYTEDPAHRMIAGDHAWSWYRGESNDGNTD